MVSVDDPIWPTLKGGYRTPYDASTVLKQIAGGDDLEACWSELWNNLHHQGDVGEASYAAVPQLAEIFASRSRDWNLYALIAVIEMERHYHDNPPIPEWIAAEYTEAMHRIVRMAAADLPSCARGPDLEAALGVIAAAKGDLGRAQLILSGDDEIEEILRDYLGYE